MGRRVGVSSGGREEGTRVFDPLPLPLLKGGEFLRIPGTPVLLN